MSVFFLNQTENQIHSVSLVDPYLNLKQYPLYNNIFAKANTVENLVKRNKRKSTSYDRVEKINNKIIPVTILIKSYF